MVNPQKRKLLHAYYVMFLPTASLPKDFNMNTNKLEKRLFGAMFRSDIGAMFGAMFDAMSCEAQLCRLNIPISLFEARSRCQ